MVFEPVCINTYIIVSLSVYLSLSLYMSSLYSSRHCSLADLNPLIKKTFIMHYKMMICCQKDKIHCDENNKKDFRYKIIFSISRLSSLKRNHKKKLETALPRSPSTLGFRRRIHSQAVSFLLLGAGGSMLISF